MTGLQLSCGRTLTIACTLCAALLPAGHADAAGSTLLLNTARVTLSGTSNVHPYDASTKTVKITRVEVSPAVAGEATDALTAPGVVEAFDISIPAATLTSPREGLDKNLHKALKVQQFADITFSLTRLEAGDAANAFRGVGKLTIAGVEREVTLALTILRTGDTLTVKGSLPLVMTDYGITPPKAMLGMLKTDPRVTIAFETVFAVPTT